MNTKKKFQQCIHNAHVNDSGKNVELNNQKCILQGDQFK